MSFVIGQGDILTTPIQVVQMMNIIASRGKIYSPTLHLNQTSQIKTLSLKSTTWDFLDDAMWNVVNHKDGTGKLAKIDGANIYGKTGTAQNPHGEDHSWFAGYMKINNDPILSLSVLVEHGGKGSIEAAMISKQIFNYVHQNDLLQ